MDRSAPGNPNVCKAQAYNLNPHVCSAQDQSVSGSPSQADTKIVLLDPICSSDHQPIGPLFRIVLKASDGPSQRAHPDEGCHRSGLPDLPQAVVDGGRHEVAPAVSRRPRDLVGRLAVDADHGAVDEELHPLHTGAVLGGRLRLQPHRRAGVDDVHAMDVDGWPRLVSARSPEHARQAVIPFVTRILKDWTRRPFHGHHG